MNAKSPDIEDAEWKRFERLVARLERALAGSSVTLRAPDKIPDKDTGDLREVDVSLRSRVGSTDVLIILEARKRGRPQDVTWIEQLATKKHRIGASAIVAITDKPLTEPAQHVAKLQRIDVRTLEESEKPGFLSWISERFSVKSDFVSRTVVGVGVNLAEPDASADLLLPEGGAFSTLTAETPIFVLADGTIFTANNILRLAEQQGLRLGNELKAGESAKKRFSFGFNDSGTFINTTNGFKVVKSVDIYCDVEVQQLSATPVFLKYKGPDGTIAESADIQFAELGLGISFVRNGTTGQTELRLIAESGQFVSPPALPKLRDFRPPSKNIEGG